MRGNKLALLSLQHFTRLPASSFKHLARHLRTQAQYDYATQEPLYPHQRPVDMATPRELVQYLNEYVIGQEQAKKVLSVAVFNHYNRVRAYLDALERERAEEQWAETSPDDPQSGVLGAHIRPFRAQQPSISLRQGHSIPLFEKSNVLVIGPTGSGKTLLAKTLAKIMDVPFSVSDATSFTQAGYVGEDVEMAIHRLLQAASWDPLRASTGIVYIDEIDKIARKGGGSGTDGARDVGGEGVQQALLRMIEGTTITIQAKDGASVESPPPGGEGRSRPGQRNPLLVTPKPESYTVDTTNVLFILSGAFSGLENIIKQRVAKGSIGFTANLNESSGPSSMPFFTPNRSTTRNPLDLVDSTDLQKYGFIPEFISRMPSVTTLAPLSVPDLRRILTDVRGSLASQYTALFGYSGVEIRFTSQALDEICLKAAEKGGGARGLRSIMESLLLEPMYETPGSPYRHVLITDAAVRGEEPAKYWRKGEAHIFWNAWAEAERTASSAPASSPA